ncbi:hypothetical protein NBO_584g0003 [Nosema bombycis CQ1]|uniref:Uncharacterized protein n=1 Tax=Nosema bombycis (strain CQ1 / CVCC 102059) TaxID=578461 RepID=R0MGW7_NOSB1|nr:hypothetical protein NBO_584g0003 [Nosema bombycis CQ1]|eukprot:EOB12028.1 hypothetical protein NBO_584g0003 [Nosema bombycis CQ1]
MFAFNKIISLYLMCIALFYNCSIDELLCDENITEEIMNISTYIINQPSFSFNKDKLNNFICNFTNDSIKLLEFPEPESDTVESSRIFYTIFCLVLFLSEYKNDVSFDHLIRRLFRSYLNSSNPCMTPPNFAPKKSYEFRAKITILKKQVNKILTEKNFDKQLVHIEEFNGRIFVYRKNLTINFINSFFEELGDEYIYPLSGHYRRSSSTESSYDEMSDYSEDCYDNLNVINHVSINAKKCMKYLNVKLKRILNDKDKVKFEGTNLNGESIGILIQACSEIIMDRQC